MELTVKVFNSIRDNIADISSAMEETEGLIGVIDRDKEVLNEAINSIAAISQRNTASTEEVTASVYNQAGSTASIYNLARELNSNSVKLKEAIDKFKF